MQGLLSFLLNLNISLMCAGQLFFSIQAATVTDILMQILMKKKTMKRRNEGRKERRKKEAGKIEAPQLQVIPWADINDHTCLPFHQPNQNLWFFYFTVKIINSRKSQHIFSISLDRCQVVIYQKDYFSLLQTRGRRKRVDLNTLTQNLL